MNRIEQFKRLNSTEIWDVIIIGGGASGLGTALDATLRGHKTLLLEAEDFAKGTSSRSTKLVHGGVRYLAQGDIKLVKEALRERGLLAKNAPHLFKNQSFLIPNYSFWNGLFYYIGLSIYDLLAGKLSIGKTKWLNKRSTVVNLQTIYNNNLKSGILYKDGQFDDARLAINLAQTAVENDACLLNHCRVTKLNRAENGKISGIEFTDQITGQSFSTGAKVVVNATGVFTDDIMRLDNSQHKKSVVPSQGIHLVFDKSFLPGSTALMIPKTSDGRVLFAVPWHNKVVVGTTDTLVDKASDEPIATEKEIEFIFDTIQQYFQKTPNRSDVLSVFAGLRPLAAPKEEGKSTKEVSRSHKIITSDSGLVSIIGGKWTTYRQMAQEIVDEAQKVGNLQNKESKTHQFKIHGHELGLKIDGEDQLYYYGSDRKKIQDLEESDHQLSEKIHPNYPYTFALVKLAIENEMAETVEDVLARRIRLLFLDARAATDSAKGVAEFMAKEMSKDQQWVEEQCENFNTISKKYLLVEYQPKKL